MEKSGGRANPNNPEAATIHPITKRSKKNNKQTKPARNYGDDGEQQYKSSQELWSKWIEYGNYHKKQIMHKPLIDDFSCGMILGRSVECSIEMWGTFKTCRMALPVTANDGHWAQQYESAGILADLVSLASLETLGRATMLDARMALCVSRLLSQGC